MCTAIGLQLGDRFFGRNLDLEQHFGESIVLTPRGFHLQLRHEKMLVTRYAILGMAAVEEKFPLYAEAINEKGVAMAGLNFVGNAAYFDEMDLSKKNITTFELIPWILGQVETLEQARELLVKVRLISTAFKETLPPSELHWFITDGEASLVVESTKKGIFVYDNPLCVLTNNPPFLFQIASSMPFLEKGRNTAKKLLESAGISAETLGYVSHTIPGDYSSPARFARAARLVESAKPLGNAEADLATCFQILSAVAPIHGSVTGSNQKEHYTLYSVCANLSSGEFYWRGAESPFVVAVRFADFSWNTDSLQVIDPKKKKG